MTYNNHPFNLENKVALVTGAAAGIGAACAESLAQAGASVLLTDIDAETCEQQANRLAKHGLKVSFSKQDVASESDWQTSIDCVFKNFGGLDILVNNAGIYVGGTVVQNTLEDIQRVQRINIDSIFLGTRYTAEAMRPGGRAGSGGTIINLSSVAGLIGVPGHSAYGMTKGAVAVYSKHTAVEFAALRYNIRVNSVHPGLIETSMGDQVFEDFVEIGLAPDVEGAKKLLLENMIPMGRFGRPEDVANLVVFLASDASAYVTGAQFVVDGGLTAA